jgi:hypothetical protein
MLPPHAACASPALLARSSGVQTAGTRQRPSRERLTAPDSVGSGGVEPSTSSSLFMCSLRPCRPVCDRIYIKKIHAIFISHNKFYKKLDSISI